MDSDGGMDGGGGGLESGGGFETGIGLSASADVAVVDYGTLEQSEASDFDAANTDQEIAPVLDPALIDTINAIGATVLNEVFGFENGDEDEEEADSLEEALDAPGDNPFQPETSFSDESVLYYDPAVWEPAQDKAEPEVTPSEQQPANSTEKSGLSPQVTAILDTIGYDLLPETSTYVSGGAEPPLSRLLYSENASTTAGQGNQSQEVFNALLKQRGLSLENAAVVTNHGLLYGEPFTDTTEYVETSTGLNLVRNTRVFTDSGRASSELVATHSLEAYMNANRPDHTKRRPVLNVHWDDQKYKYEMEWRNQGPQPFPEDVEVPIRDEFQGRWQAEKNGASYGPSPIVVRDQEELKLPDDETIFKGVHSSLKKAHPINSQTRVIRS